MSLLSARCGALSHIVPTAVCLFTTGLSPRDVVRALLESHQETDTKFSCRTATDIMYQALWREEHRKLLQYVEPAPVPFPLTRSISCHICIVSYLLLNVRKVTKLQEIQKLFPSKIPIIENTGRKPKLNSNENLTASVNTSNTLEVVT